MSNDTPKKTSVEFYPARMGGLKITTKAFNYNDFSSSSFSTPALEASQPSTKKYFSNDTPPHSESLLEVGTPQSDQSEESAESIRRQLLEALNQVTLDSFKPASRPSM